MIKIKRVYDTPEPDDGLRFLLDRLWPQGVKKEAIKLDGWFKDIAPGDSLRQWFGHEASRWDEFCARYFVELDRHPEAWKHLLRTARTGTITLLYSAREPERNNAAALRSYLEKRLAFD